MGLSYEDRRALRARVSAAQHRRFWREKRMNLFGDWDGYRRSQTTEPPPRKVR